VLSPIRQLRKEEAGFSLVELLVVTLIIGALAAVALANLFGQREKAVDTQAIATAHTAQVTIESCGAQKPDGYEGCDANELRSMEPTLPADPTLKVSGLAKDEYTIVVQSVPESHTFTIQRTGKGVVSFTCNEKGDGGCPLDGTWG
jgi:prepilin-type N-terminal cleavage/methylation domain-containing protein